MFDIFEDYKKQRNLENRVYEWFRQAAQPAFPDSFVCLALQHKTLDYIAVVKDQPKQAVFIEAVPNFSEQPDHKKHAQQFGMTSIINRKKDHGQPIMPIAYTYKKAHVQYFSEEISEIETLKDSRYTVFCLQTKIYVYSHNGRCLFDIITCCNPAIYAAISKSLSFDAVIASLYSSSTSDYKEDSVQVRDYSSSAPFASDFRIVKPFGSGYEIGALSLDEEGHRLAVVSKDACYMYLYIICCVSVGKQDPKKPEPSTAEVKEPIQRFIRGQTSASEIFKPIQIFISNLHPQAGLFPCNFILLSSSSDTMHLFRIGEAAQIQAEQLTQSIFSRLFTSSERS